MGNTNAFTLQPNEWTIIGQSKNVRMLQASGQKSMRLHFGDIRDVPAADTENYILTQDYNPRPIDFDPKLAAYEEEVVFARPHDGEPLKVVVVTTADRSAIFAPPSGVLPNAKVGTALSQSFVMPWDRPAATFSIADGSLPPGLALNGDGFDSRPNLAGTPTQVGTFVFTIKAAWNEMPLTVGVFPAGSIEQTYVITVEAAS